MVKITWTDYLLILWKLPDRWWQSCCSPGSEMWADSSLQHEAMRTWIAFFANYIPSTEHNPQVMEHRRARACCNTWLWKKGVHEPFYCKIILKKSQQYCEMVPLTSENLYSLMPHGSLPSNHPGPSSVMTLWLRERVSSRSMPKHSEQTIGDSFTFPQPKGGQSN
jgi:hypothetical protein